MKLTRTIVATFLTFVLLVSVLLTASAEANGNAYGRWDNPGQGHDWKSEDLNENSNSNDNKQHNDNGYLNHEPHDDDPGIPC